MEKKRGRPRKRTHPTKEDLILQYEHTPLPVFFVNQKLEVFHANIYAYENYHAMTLADGLWSVLPEGASGECIRHLQAGEDFRVDLPLLKATRASLAFSPLWEKDSIYGGVAFLTAVAEKELPGLEVAAGSSAGAFSGLINQIGSNIMYCLTPMRDAIRNSGDTRFQDQLPRIAKESYRLFRSAKLISSYLESCSDRQATRTVVDFWERMAALLSATRDAAALEPTPFEYTLPKDTIRVCCSFPDIEVAVLSVIDNSFSHTRPDNRIMVTGRNLPGAVQILVSDRGRGIPPEELSRIFIPFYSRGAGGEPLVGQTLGLGLTVARQIIYGHGGSIAVESAPGEGTTVAFTIPTTEEPLSPLVLRNEIVSFDYARNHYSAVYLILCDHVRLPIQD